MRNPKEYHKYYLRFYRYAMEFQNDPANAPLLKKLLKKERKNKAVPDEKKKSKSCKAPGSKVMTIEKGNFVLEFN